MFAITSMMLIGFLMKTSFLGQDQKRRMHSMVNHTTHVVSMTKRMSFSVCTYSSSSYSMNAFNGEPHDARRFTDKKDVVFSMHVFVFIVLYERVVFRIHESEGLEQRERAQHK